MAYKKKNQYVSKSDGSHHTSPMGVCSDPSQVAVHHCNSSFSRMRMRLNCGPEVRAAMFLNLLWRTMDLLSIDDVPAIDVAL